MAKFWLATFGKARPAASRTPLAARTPISAAAPLAGAPGSPLAVEIVEDNGEYAVLFSVVDDPTDPKTFVCRIGFANGSKSCAVWSDRGFPLVDAVIEPTKDGGLTVRSPSFVAHDPIIQYESEVASISKLPEVVDAPKSELLNNTQYEQALRGPDVVSPATHIEAKAITWFPQSRSNVRESQDSQSTFQVNPSRYPILAPFPHAPTRPTRTWSGNIKLPVWNDRKLPDEKVVTMSRTETFGVAAFEFKDLEVLGFRIDPRKLGWEESDLAKALGFRIDPRKPGWEESDDLANLMDELIGPLVAPLNFHRRLSPDRVSAVTRSAVSDFQFRAATYTVMVELLRYGKMKLKTESQPLTTKDFQSQHELLARILVGRVDDDTAQARDAATFVPTIFVDNSWSKTLGRAVQGFDKRMANFCVPDEGNRRVTPLRPDGRLAKDDKHPKPLGSITRIALANRTGGESGPTLLELNCPPDAIDDGDAFVKVDPRFALGPVPLAPMSWLQTDFDQAEYRRAFARSVVKDWFKEFSSIQVSPVGGTNLKEELEKQTTWIRGTTRFGDDVEIAWPTGTARLTFHADPSTPKAWRQLCKLFRIGEGEQSTIVMPTRTWYRMRCSMDMTIKNDLD